MSRDPYETGLIKKSAISEKRAVVGELVALLGLRKLEKRGLELIFPRSRALLKNEIHELLLTDEQDAGPGNTVNRILGICFFEVKTGGIALVGDKVSIGKKVIGEIAGFDMTHMPNHMNVVIKADERVMPEAKIGYEIMISR